MLLYVGNNFVLNKEHVKYGGAISLLWMRLMLILVCNRPKTCIIIEQSTISFENQLYYVENHYIIQKQIIFLEISYIMQKLHH